MTALFVLLLFWNTIAGVGAGFALCTVLPHVNPPAAQAAPATP